MTRIDHTNHNHPATPAARAICRKSPARPAVPADAIRCFRSDCGRTPEIMLTSSERWGYPSDSTHMYASCARCAKFFNGITV